MKKVMFVFGIFASVVLVSCGSKSGQRQPGKAVRVREVETNQVNFVRLNTVEQGIYRVGDTLKMNGLTHSVVYNIEDIVSLKHSGMLENIIIEK
jgi:hypothetical protein